MDFLSAFTTVAFYVGEYHFLGYLAVFLAAFLETIPFTGLFVPSNIIMILAGIFAYETYLSGSLVLTFAVVAGILGDLFSYWLGKRYNHSYEKKSLAKKRAYFEKAEVFFKEHGGKSIFSARFIGPLRPFIAFIAGAAKMRLSLFLSYSIVSSIVWAVAFFFIGYAFEGSIISALGWLEKVDRVIFGVFIALVAMFITHRYLLPRLRKQKIPETPVEK